jgi:tetratricopeptide (TPR) repeat protein
MRFVNMMKVSLMAIGLAFLPVAVAVQGVPEAVAQQAETDREAEKEAKKAAREAEKEAKKAEAEAKKAAREAERQAKKAEAEAKRAAKKAEAEAEKAAKKAEADAKRAAKKAEAEAKKAAREAEKQAKNAEAEARKAARNAEEATGAEEARGAEEATATAAAAKKTGPEARREARELSRRGLAHFGKGEYDQAIECFIRAHELDPLPEHQFNLAWAYKRKGDKRSAYESFQNFLAANPRDRNMVQEARENSDELKLYIDAEDALLADSKALKEQVEQTQQEVAELRTRHEDAMSQKSDELEATRKELAEAQAGASQGGTASGSGAGGGKRTAGTAMLVAGGVALGAAIVSGAEARSADRKLDGLGPGDIFSESRVWLHERGEAAEKRMVIFSITGAALVAGGAVVYYLGERDARRPSQLERGPLAITPAVSPSSAGIQVSGSF